VKRPRHEDRYPHPASREAGSRAALKHEALPREEEVKKRNNGPLAHAFDGLVFTIPGEQGDTSQFQDDKQREYDIVTTGALFDDYAARGQLQPEDWVNPNVYLLGDKERVEDEVDLGPQLLVVTLPRDRFRKHYSDLDTPRGDPATLGQVVLIHRATRRRCVAHFTAGGAGSFHPNNRHGYLFCQSFVVYVDVID
jgi:hypothetical protein